MNKKGFSIIEVVVAVGIFSAATIALLKGVSIINKGEQSLGARAELNVHLTRLSYVFNDLESCRSNLKFIDGRVELKDPKKVYGGGSEFFSYPLKIYNYRIDSLSVGTDYKEIIINISKKNTNKLYSTVKPLRLFLNLKYDEARNPIDCIDERERLKESFLYEISQRICKKGEYRVRKLGGRKSTCLAKESLNQDAFSCDSGSYLNKVELFNNDGIVDYVYTCRENKGCPTGKIGLSHGGELKCHDMCPSGKMTFLMNEGVRCLDFTCPVGSYVSRIRESGVECKKLIDSSVSECVRFKLINNSSGELTLECI